MRRVTDAEEFLAHAWTVGLLDERFGDDLRPEPDPQELLENAETLGLIEADEEVPGTEERLHAQEGKP